MRDPNKINAYRISYGEYNNNIKHVNGTWVPSRPTGYSSFVWRCRLAWAVFTGRMDALEWPGQDG